MTLAEFLFARIDEDERDARQRSQMGEGRGTPRVKPSPGRVRDDCESKRRIVEIHEHRARHDDTSAGDWSRATLELLALPYMDHGDYRAEWRPNI